MDPLHTFTKEFTDEQFDHVLEGDTYFTPTSQPTSGELMYMGERLGKKKRTTFYPSLALLDKVAPHTKRKAIINSKSAWLFICGKNVLKEGIIECNAEKGHVLIMNQAGDVLGYGKITGAGITNKLDRGDFLRRER